jgi:hypothetical protein
MDVSQPPAGVFVKNSHREPTVDCDMVKSILANGEAEALLVEYRSMSKFFPFVPIDANVSMQDLSVTKPMLFLAIITAASWKDHKRQMALDLQYRTELAKRTMVQPRRTLSLLQGVLVYLSWWGPL